MAGSNRARVVISWNAKANAYVSRGSRAAWRSRARKDLAEAARELAAAVETKGAKPLLAGVDAIQREVSRKRLRVTRKQIAAEVRAARAGRRHG